MALVSTYLFGSVHWITANTTVSPEHRAAFVAQNEVILGDVFVDVNSGVRTENQPGSWNYFYVDDDNSVVYGKKLNPSYHATTNPSVRQYAPLQFFTAEEAQDAYDALT